MSRVKITEYRAKKMLVGDGYAGVAIVSGTLPHISTTEKWVVKVDQGIKKRMKQGLVKVGVSASDVPSIVAQWEGKGFSRFLAEPLFAHDEKEERYISFERVRAGVRVLYAQDGGIDIEAHPEVVSTHVIANEKDIESLAHDTQLPVSFLSRVYALFNTAHVAFLEINPLVVREGIAIPLDAAVLVDDTATFFSGAAWDVNDIVRANAKHPAEAHVEALAATTPAALKLSVVNPDGALFFLLSGGGGSIVIVDEAAAQGVAGLIGNYGEYSGGPTREETYLYAKEVLSLMLASKSPKKALVIAGGIANFTDVKETFAGVIDALTEVAEQLHAQQVQVFVRRGGPNEATGLGAMRTFLEREGLLGAVYGSSDAITSAVADAIRFVK